MAKKLRDFLRSDVNTGKMAINSAIKDTKTIDNIKLLYRKQNNYRDLLLFEIGINTGFALNDMLKLRVKDVKNKQYLVLENSKTFPLNNNMKELILTLIKDKNNNDYIFSTRQGKPLNRSTVFNSFRNICTELALHNYSVASWRKTFAYHYYQKYKDLSYLQWLFNQSTVEQTLQFIGVNENMNLRFREVVWL